jgi:hypothetical protein
MPETIVNTAVQSVAGEYNKMKNPQNHITGFEIM